MCGLAGTRHYCSRTYSIPLSLLLATNVGDYCKGDLFYDVTLKGVNSVCMHAAVVNYVLVGGTDLAKPPARY